MDGLDGHADQRTYRATKGFYEGVLWQLLIYRSCNLVSLILWRDLRTDPLLEMRRI